MNKTMSNRRTNTKPQRAVLNDEQFADSCAKLLNAGTEQHQAELREPLAASRTLALRVAAQAQARQALQQSQSPWQACMAAVGHFIHLKPLSATALFCLLLISAPASYIAIMSSGNNASVAPNSLSLEAAIDQDISPDELPLLLEEQDVEMLEMLEILLAMNDQGLG